MWVGGNCRGQEEAATCSPKQSIHSAFFLNSNFDISIGLKGIVHLGIFFASNLTFWIVMIRGKGHLGHMGFKHF